MASEYDLSVIIKLIDKFRRPSKEVGVAAISLGEKIGSLGTTSRISMTHITGLIDPLFKLGAALGTVGMGAGLWAVKGTLDLDVKLGKLETSIKGTAERTEEIIKGWRRSFHEFGMEYPIPKAVEQMTEAARTGLRVYQGYEDVLERVKLAALGAYAAGTGTAQDALSLISQLQVAYKDLSLETFELMANMLPKAIHTSRLEFRAYSHAVGRAAPLFAKLGISWKEFIASSGELTKVIGGRTSIVGFQLSSLMTALARYRDVPPIIRRLEKERPGRGWIEFLKILRDVVAGSKDAEARLYKAFGSRGEAAAALLLDLKTIESLEDLYDFFEDTSKVLDYNLESILKMTTGTQDAAAAWIDLKNTSFAFRDAVGEVLKPKVVPWIVSMTNELEKATRLMWALKDFEEMEQPEKKKRSWWWGVPYDFWTDPFKRGEFFKGEGAAGKPFVKYTPEKFTEVINKIIPHAAIRDAAIRGGLAIEENLPIIYNKAAEQMKETTEPIVTMFREMRDDVTELVNALVTPKESVITVRLESPIMTGRIVEVDKDPNVTVELENSVLGGAVTEY